MEESTASSSRDEETAGKTAAAASPTTASSPHAYFQRRFDGSQRRHELLEKLNKNSPPLKQGSSKQPSPSASASHEIVTTHGLQIPDPTVNDDSGYQHPYEDPKLRPSSFLRREENDPYSTAAAAASPYHHIDETKEEIGSSPTKDRILLNSINDATATSSPCTPPAPKRQPLHLETTNHIIDNHEHNTAQLQYYKVVYRGVVALLSNEAQDDDHNNLKKSGAYLSYGEIFASSHEQEVEDTSSSPPPTPSRRQQQHPSPRLGSAVSSPILSQVWEQQSSSSPPRSLVSATGSISSLETSKTASTVMQFQQQQQPHASLTDTASMVTAAMRMRKLIRVDRVLTGGYAVDAKDDDESSDDSVLQENFATTHVVDAIRAHATTPKRGNTHPPPPLVPPVGGRQARIITGTAPVPIADSVMAAKKGDDSTINVSLLHPTLETNNYPRRPLGCLYSEHSRVPIAIPIEETPECELGTFRYRVVSSTPLPILTGPCSDAPRTKAILIPGTVHEVCLRVTIPRAQSGESQTTLDGAVTFLRLTRRRGWVADRRVSHAAAIRGKQNPSFNHAGSSSMSSSNTPQGTVLTMKDITNEEVLSREDGEASVSSKVTSATITSAVATPISAIRGRHRPPRRRQRIAKDVIDSTSLPRHVIGPSLSQSRNHNDTSALTDNSILMNTSNVSYHDPRAIVSPSSNISLLSDGSSSLDATNKSHGGGGGPMTPDRSVARSIASSSSNYPSFFLMRVNAPRGLKILDAPHFQVNNLIHGNHTNVSGNTASNPPGNYSPMKDGFGQSGGNQSIFQTMAGQTAMTSKISNPAVFDSITKARKLPRGSVFEASKRMEASNAFSQGAGLIKLSDNSGWAIVPRQSELDDQYRTYSGSLAQTREGEATRAFEEVGNALVDENSSTLFLRVLTKGGISVSLPPVPSTESDVETSPTSSTTGSSVPSGINGALPGQILSQDSDVASSVGSSFLDAMFRTPPKKSRDSDGHDSSRIAHAPHQKPPTAERPMSTVLPCGMCVEVERWVDPSDPEHGMYKNEFARLRGGQGWIPRFLNNNRPIVETVSPPEFRFGSFWFRVQDQRGIKVRLGPSRRAPSIKSDDGVYFRFECGEYLRASEIVTFFRRHSAIECFAKLYRNRHLRFHAGDGEVRSLASLTAQAEWVQVFGDNELYLEECAAEPRIERHRQGWRYNVVLDARVNVRQGPSFSSETVGVVLLGGESVLINERVTGPDDSITWLRLKDGQGWVHNYGQKGESLMIPHSLRHRVKTIGGQSGRPGRGGEEIPYNTIIARLFHNDVPGDQSPSKESRGGSSRMGRR